MLFPPARGVIFDLDGTLVDSGLDFDQMRAEMGLPSGQPILESIASLPASEARRCWQILDRHELEGAARATPMPGVHDLLALLSSHRLRRGVLTRNSRDAAMMCLGRLGVTFDVVLAREDAPPKPDPTGILNICAIWEMRPTEVAMVGDYRFDVEAAGQAGSRAVLYTHGQSPDRWTAWPADYRLHSFTAAAEFVRWLEQPL